MTARATIAIEKADDLYHVRIYVDGDSNKEATHLVNELYDIMTGPRETWIRVLPKADTQKDYTSNTEIHHGYARFTMSKNDGPQHLPDEAEVMDFASLRYKDAQS